MRQFVCSVVVGKDLVPRLGIITLDNLKRQMMNQLNSCRLPKVPTLLHFWLLSRITVCMAASLFLSFCCIVCAFINVSQHLIWPVNLSFPCLLFSQPVFSVFVLDKACWLRQGNLHRLLRVQVLNKWLNVLSVGDFEFYYQMFSSLTDKWWWWMI